MLHRPLHDLIFEFSHIIYGDVWCDIFIDYYELITSISGAEAIMSCDYFFKAFCKHEETFVPLLVSVIVVKFLEIIYIQNLDGKG